MSVVPLPRTDERRGVDDPTLKRAVHRRLVMEHVDEPVPDGSDLRARLSRLLRDEHPLLPAARLDRLVGELVDEVAGLGPLEPLLGDPDVTEVMINGPGHAFVERRGEMVAVELGLDAASIVRPNADPHAAECPACARLRQIAPAASTTMTPSVANASSPPLP